jgi:ComF family protein
VQRTDSAQPIGQRLRRLGGQVLDVLLPPRCVTCDDPVERPGMFCAGCFRKVGFISAPFCTRCGIPLSAAAKADSAGLCGTCQTQDYAFDQVRAPFRYDIQARRLILPFKYADRTDLAPVLAVHMARAGADLLARADVLVPVPLHRSRLFRRKYNQAALLAQALRVLSRRPAAIDALIRTRRTAAMGTRSATERAMEVAEAFAIRPGRQPLIADRRVLLIDDVMTSGATVDACARALRAAGSIAVDVLVAARVPDPRVA